MSADNTPSSYGPECSPEPVATASTAVDLRDKVREGYSERR
jgi:hypothetical protein